MSDEDLSERAKEHVLEAELGCRRKSREELYDDAFIAHLTAGHGISTDSMDTLFHAVDKYVVRRDAHLDRKEDVDEDELRDRLGLDPDDNGDGPGDGPA